MANVMHGSDNGDMEVIGPPLARGALWARLFGLAWRHRWFALLTIAATVAFQMLTLVGLVGQGLAIDLIRRVADSSAPSPAWPFGLAPPDEWSFLAQVAVVGAVILASAVLGGAARLLTRMTDELFVQACLVDLRQRLYDKLQHLSFGFFDRTNTGQIINRVTGDSQKVRSFIQGVMIRGGIALVTLAIFLAYMVREQPLLAIACAAMLPLQALVMLRYARLTKPKFLEQSRKLDDVIKSLQEAIAGVRVIRVFGREREQTQHFDAQAALARDHRISIGKDQALHLPFVQASNIFGQAVLLGFGGWLVVQGPSNGGIALGMLWVFRGLLDRLSRQAEMLVMLVSETPEALAGAERVFRLLSHNVEIESKPGATLPSGTIQGHIEFRNVTFGYHPEKPVLHDVSFTAQPGEIIAIVGPTGSGKSTLLSLIGRFYDPQAGAVLIDGIDARDLPVDALRHSMGIVFQEPFLFSNTVRSNISFGAPDASMEAIEQAAQAAEADGFINDLLAGYDTIIGERGVSLSGGQRQRLTIARALIMNPRCLLLDDATGAVDSITESRIQSSLERHFEGRTTFIVAHRLSTLRKADRVIVLENGHVVDVGSHDELINRPGHYRAAALIQLSLDDESLDVDREAAS